MNCEFTGLMEIRDEEGLRRVWRRLGGLAAEVFYREEMTEELFLGLFLSGSYLYEVFSGAEAVGIVFLFAENPYAVKIGAAAYGGRASYRVLSGVYGCLRKWLRARGVRCMVAEVPSGKRNIRRLLPRLGFRMSECVEGYYGDESLLIFSVTL